MYKRCKNNCCGDYWSLTVDKIYEILGVDNKYLMYIEEGNRRTEVRYLIKDDLGDTYWFPEYCFADVLH